MMPRRQALTVRQRIAEGGVDRYRDELRFANFEQLLVARSLPKRVTAHKRPRANAERQSAPVARAKRAPARPRDQRRLRPRAQPRLARRSNTDRGRNHGRKERRKAPGERASPSICISLHFDSQ
jgi:hypothetical protein